MENSFQIHLANLSFRASIDPENENKIVYSARTCAHEECLISAFGKEDYEKAAQTRNLIETKYFSIGIWGYDCGFDTVCPFCNKSISEGMEICMWSK